MPTSDPARVVTCPSCGRKLGVPATGTVKLKCPGCDSSFVAPAGPPAGVRAADRQNQTARIIAASAGAAFLIIVMIAYAMRGGDDDDARAPARPTTPPPRAAAPVSKSPAPRAIARDFLGAMARGDRSAVERLFSFDAYFAARDVSKRTRGDVPFDQLSPEQRAALRTRVVDNLIGSETASHVDAAVLTALGALSHPNVTETWDGDVATVACDVLDEARRPLVSVRVTLALRSGFTLARDGSRNEAWAVIAIEDQWHQASLEVPAPETQARDLAIDRAARKGRGSAEEGPRFPEATPAILPPVAGTSPALQAEMERWIQALTDPEAPAREFSHARERLSAVGKPAIPALLNALVGKDHRQDERAIRQTSAILRLLEEITGQRGFGYGAVAGRDAIGAQPEQAAAERERAVRRWFGWWDRNGSRFQVRTPEADPEPAEPEPAPAPEPRR